MPSVQLEDDDGGGIPNVEPKSAKVAMVKAGVAKTTRQANLILFLIAIVLISGMVFFLRMAVPPEKKALGDDVPRRGEVIPSNRSL